MLPYLTPSDLEAMTPEQIANRMELEQTLLSRQNEYPPITDYLDGIVKGDQEQIDKYIADCLAVKERNPKPE